MAAPFQCPLSSISGFVCVKLLDFVQDRRCQKLGPLHTANSINVVDEAHMIREVCNNILQHGDSLPRTSCGKLIVTMSPYILDCLSDLAREFSQL